MDHHPCGICGMHVLETDEAIQCDGKCSLWHHRECLGMTLATYLSLSKDQGDWVCRKCVKIKQEIKQEAQTSSRLRQRHPEEEMGKSSKSDFRQLDFISESQKCMFCQTTEIDETKYGPVYTHKNIVTHYYCLLLSSNMEQNGRDTDGILGFLANDINKEVRRGSRLFCSYCRAKGSTLGCAIAKCKVVFHLPCGLKHGTLHQFYGEFKSYCNKHRPVQKISESILAESSKGAMCGICYEKVIPRPVHDTLWAPCCQKSAFFHRDCVQRLATSAGYFFKCPLCNNVDTFQQAMKEFGIFIPEQDASWERVPNAYQDLLVRHDSCDNSSCKCPSGRKTNIQGTRWELILCKFCGSQGVHIGCGRLRWKSPEFECDACSADSTEGNRSMLGDRHRLAPATPPSLSAIREGERNRERNRSMSSDDSLPLVLNNQRRRVVSPRSSPSLSPSSSPKPRVVSPEKRHRDLSSERRHKAVSPERRHKALSPERRQRAVSPERRHRIESPERRHGMKSPERRHRMESPQGKHRMASPERKHRIESPERRHRMKSPERRHRMASPERKHRAVSPEHRKSTIDKLKKKLSERKEYKSRPIVIDDSDDDVEVVDITGNCLKTSDGSTIQVVPVAGGQKRLRVEGDVRVLDNDDVEVVDTNVKFPKVQVPSPPPLKEVIYSLPPPTPQPSTSTTVPAFNPAQSYVLVDPNSYRSQDYPAGAMLFRSVQPVVNLSQQPMQQQQLGSTSDADTKYTDLSKYRDWSSINFHPQYLQIQETSRDDKCGHTRQRRGGYNFNRLNPTVRLPPLQFRINNGHCEIYLRETPQTLIFTKRKASPLVSKVAKKLKKTSKKVLKGDKPKKQRKSETKFKLSKSLFSIGKSKEPSLKCTKFYEDEMKLQPIADSVITLASASITGDELSPEIKKHCTEGYAQTSETKTSKKAKLKKSPLLRNLNYNKIENYLIKVDTTFPPSVCNQSKVNFKSEDNFEFSSNSTNNANTLVVSVDTNNENESKTLPSLASDNQPIINKETDTIIQPLISISATVSACNQSKVNFKSEDNFEFSSNSTNNANTLVVPVDTNNENESKTLPSLSSDNQPIINKETDTIIQPLFSISATVTTNEENLFASPLKDNTSSNEEIKCLQPIDTNTLDENSSAIKGSFMDKEKCSSSQVESVLEKKKILSFLKNNDNLVKPTKIKCMQKNKTGPLYDLNIKKRTHTKKICVNKASLIENYFQRIEIDACTDSWAESNHSSTAVYEGRDDSEDSETANQTPKSFDHLSRPKQMLEMAHSIARLFK